MNGTTDMLPVFIGAMLCAWSAGAHAEGLLPGVMKRRMDASLWKNRDVLTWSPDPASGKPAAGLECWGEEARAL